MALRIQVFENSKFTYANKLFLNLLILMLEHMQEFLAAIEIIGINPFVFVPDNILQSIFEAAGRNKGPIPVKGLVNDKPFKQTLVKYSGFWRLYINLLMLEKSPQRVGEVIKIMIEFDGTDRSLTPHPKLLEALDRHLEAKAIYGNLTPSLRKEIVRYIGNLKTEESVDRNIQKAINFLLGKERFIGRDKP